MKMPSKSVFADSPVEIETIIEIAKRFSVNNYKRPVANKGKWERTILEFCDGRPLVLDAGCGVGESSFHLGAIHSECAVLGVDKSKDRVERKNSFKKELPGNVMICEGDMLDIWTVLKGLVEEDKIKIEKQYVLYPNPWPKNKGLKKRWYANPILPFMMALNSPIELRSNWKRYLEDFMAVARALFGYEGEMKSVEGPSITPFERKYLASGQDLYCLNLELK